MDVNCEKPAIKKNADELFITSCLSTCTAIFKTSDSKDLGLFQNNCRKFSEDQKRSFTLWGAAAVTGKILDQALVQCLPKGGVKAVVGTVEFVVALPGMIGSLLSSAWNGDQDAKAELKKCGEFPECRRAMARNTLRFRDRNPDGSWKVSDQEVDSAIKPYDIDFLHRMALQGRSLIEGDCRATARGVGPEIFTGEAIPQEKRKKIYDELHAKDPFCPEILNFPLEAPKEVSQGECLRTNPQPLDCLSFREKMAVETVCKGQEFTDQKVVEFCSEVVSMVAPVPLVGPATKFLKVAKGEARAFGVVDGAAADAAATASKENKTRFFKTENSQMQNLNTHTKDKEFVTGATTEKTVTDVSSSASGLTRTPKLNQFVEEYKGRVLVSKEQNSRFIEKAENSAKASKENKTRSFESENWQIQNLNTYTNDKEVVTSATNFQKETMLSRLDKLEKKYPGMQFELYSDFKTIKVGVHSDKPIDAATDEALFNDLNKIFPESNQEFAAKMKELGLEVPEVGEADTWFKAGFAVDYEKASLTARRGRTVDGSSSRVLNFETPEVRGHLEGQLKNVENTRKALASTPSMKPLMEKTKAGVTLPKQEVFDLIRKNKNPDDLASAISKRYKLSSFTADDAKKLQDYAKGVDEFSPTLLIPERVTPSLDNAVSGGVTADFLGMGSANARATAEALASGKGLDDTIEKARIGEKTVTKTFQKRMEAFKKVVGGNVTCTGDDCVRIAATTLSEKEKTKIMKALASNPETRGVRMSFIGPGVSREARMQLASHGESIEKAFRKQLEGKVPFAKLQKMTFGFDMKTTNLNQGNVNLIIGKPSTTRLSRKEQTEMQKAFARAIADFNKKSAAYNQGTSRVSTSSLTLVPGGGIFGASED